MAGSYPSNTNPGLFVPTTYIWDVSQLYSTDVTSTEFKELLVRMYQNINAIQLAINIKDSGYYVEEEFVNGQLFFPNPTAVATPSLTTPTYRQVFRKTVNFGALPNAASKSVAHGITVDANTSFTRIYGAGTNPSTSFIPLPYASTTLNQNIQVDVDATNVTITTGIDRTAYTTTYIVLEYLKN